MDPFPTRGVPDAGLAFLSGRMVCAGVRSALAFAAKLKLGFYDSLDAVGFTAAGGLYRLRRRAVDALAVSAHSAVVVAILSLIVKHTTGLCLSGPRRRGAEE